jgi:hypothetical protein
MSRGSAGGRNPNKHCKTAGLQFFEFDAGVAESFFDSGHRGKYGIVMQFAWSVASQHKVTSAAADMSRFSCVSFRSDLE